MSLKMTLPFSTENCLVGSVFCFSVRFKTICFGRQCHESRIVYTNPLSRTFPPLQLEAIPSIAANLNPPLDLLTMNGRGFVQLWGVSLTQRIQLHPTAQNPTALNPLRNKTVRLRLVITDLPQFRRRHRTGHLWPRPWPLLLLSGLPFSVNAVNELVTTSSREVSLVVWICFLTLPTVHSVTRHVRSE